MRNRIEPGDSRGPGREQSADAVLPLRRLDRWQAETIREDLADLYVEASDGEPGQEYRNREEFLGRLAEDVRQPGFDMLIAERATLAGCVLGFPVGRDGSWWRGFVGTLPQHVERLTASGHFFAVTETVVHPYEREPGLARRLQETLLADQPSSFGAMLIDLSDDAAWATYQSWGWQEIGRARSAADSTYLRALVIPLGEQAPRNPGGLNHDSLSQRPAGSAESL